MLRLFRLSDSVAALLVRATGAGLVVSVVSAALGLAVQALLARLMGVHEFGLFMVAMAWLYVLSLPALGGYGVSLIRCVAEYNARREWGLLRGLITHARRRVLWSSVIVAAVAAIVLIPLTAPPHGALLIALCLLPLWTANQVRQAVLRGLKRVVAAKGPELLIRPAVLLLLCLFWRFAVGPLDAALAMGLNMVAVVAALAAGMVFLRHAMPAEAGTAAPVYDRAGWLALSLPLGLMSAMAALLGRADLIMLEALRAPGDAGLYAASLSIAAIVNLGPNAVSGIAAPLFSEYYHADDRARLRRALRHSQILSALCALACGLALMVMAPFVLSAFGKDFMAARDPLLILLFGQMAGAVLGGSCNYMLGMTGHQKALALIYTAAAAGCLVANFILIPLWGMVGAALANAAVTILLQAGLRVYAARIIRI